MFKLLFLVFKAFCNMALNFLSSYINRLIISLYPPLLICHAFSCLCALRFLIPPFSVQFPAFWTPLGPSEDSTFSTKPTLSSPSSCPRNALLPCSHNTLAVFLTLAVGCLFLILYTYRVLCSSQIIFTNRGIIYLGGFYSYLADNSGLENLSNLFSIIELIFGRIRIQTQVLLTSKDCGEI